MDSTSSDQLEKPQRLKYIVSNVVYINGNTLLHQLVLDNSDPNSPVSENYIAAVLRSMSDISKDKVNALNDDGLTALHLAVLKKNLLMMEKLLSCFANININARSDIDDKTALHYAAEWGHFEAVNLLVTYGADVDARDEYNRNPLVDAVHPDLERLLYYKSRQSHPEIYLRPDCGGGDGQSLGDALIPFRERIEIVRLLLGNGANISALNRDVRTPVVLAAKLGLEKNHDCFEKLRRNGI